MKEEKKDKEEQKDFCVNCGQPTKYTKSTSVSQREYYIEGCGQLCAPCYKEIYCPILAF